MTAKPYNIHDYDVPLTTVDVVIFTVAFNQLHVLLVKRAGEPDDPHNGKWSLPGGFINLKNDVDIEATAKRKLLEKTGVAAPYLKQVGQAVGNGTRDWRGWSLTIPFFALLPMDKMKLQPGKGADEVKWVPVTLVEDMTLAFDHKELIEMAAGVLRERVRYTTLPVLLMPTEFTLPQLQNTFEIILGEPLEVKSFRRRITNSGAIQVIAREPALNKGRPAMRYRATSQDPHYFIRNITGSREKEAE